MEQSYECLAFANLIQSSRGREQSWPWVGDVEVTGWDLWVSGVALKFGTTLGMANLLAKYPTLPPKQRKFFS